MEHDLQNKTKQKQCNLKQIKDDLYAISKNSTAQLLPDSLTNTTTKNKYAQFKKIKINLKWL